MPGRVDEALILVELDQVVGLDAQTGFKGGLVPELDRLDVRPESGLDDGDQTFLAVFFGGFSFSSGVGASGGSLVPNQA